MTQKKGFTLIELLVVIAIIGILSAIGLVALTGAQGKARDSQRKTDLATIRTALQLYYDDAGNTYPAGGGTITNNGGTNGAGTGAGAFVATTGAMAPYIATNPNPPKANGVAGADTYTLLVGTDTTQPQFELYTRLEAGSKSYYTISSKTGIFTTAGAPTCTTTCTDPV